MSRDNSKARLWAARFDRFRRSGLSISQFCRNEDITIQAFAYWRKRIDSIPGVDEARVSTSCSDSASSHLRLTIEARGVKIECQCESLQAIDSVLSWAMRQQDAGFQQLIVHG